MSGKASLLTPGGGKVILTPDSSITADVEVKIPSRAGTMATQEYAAQFGMFRNRIINGDMRIDQRNAGASVSNNTTGTQYTLDRWLAYGSQASKFTVQQNAGSVTPPVGFSNYAGITSSSAHSIGASEEFSFTTKIEGFNVADLAWGTANAQSVTLSFWVRSSLTGTFAGSLYNISTNRFYVFSYSIPSANTWTPISVTIAGDTTGTWNTTNGIGIAIRFSLGAGSTASGTAGSWEAANYVTTPGAVNLVATNGATWYVTGVQLEKGSRATPFEFRSYGQELALCQRYGYLRPGISSIVTQYGSNYGIATSQVHPVTMRASPTLHNGTSWTIQGVTAAATNIVFNADTHTYGLGWNGTNGVPNTNFGCYLLNANQNNTFVSAEL